jgi:hypothetical protein
MFHFRHYMGFQSLVWQNACQAAKESVNGNTRVVRSGPRIELAPVSRHRYRPLFGSPFMRRTNLGSAIAQAEIFRSGTTC